MILSAFPPQTPLSNNTPISKSTPLFSPIHHKPHHHHLCRAAASAAASPLSLPHAAAATSPSLLHVTDTSNGEVAADEALVSSAAAVAAAIRNASTSPVEFVQVIEKEGAKNKALVLPSPDFRRLCVEQLDLFRRIVDPDALLSVYVRPAGSYVMDQLELRRIISYPGVDAADIVLLVSNFSIPAGLRAAEAAISSQQAEILPDLGAVVFPMVKHPFVVGFLVAELPTMSLKGESDDTEECVFTGQSFALTHKSNQQPTDIQKFEDHSVELSRFTREQKLNAVNITRSLSMAYVMDQKSMLLQQSSWQNNVRMSNLVEQIRGSLSSIRTLSKMLSVHMRSEISYDIVEDILVQSDQMRETLQQLQDAVYLTKANIMRYNSETLKKMHLSTGTPADESSQSSNTLSGEASMIKMKELGRPGPLISSESKDLEFPMPPLALAPHEHGISRPSNVSDILGDLVGAVQPLARKQQRAVELCELSKSLQVAVQEPALRQALSNLIEGALLRTQAGGKVEIVSTGAPAGGALVIIDDDGPDMHYMTQMHSLAPFGKDLLSENKIEDNMTWNFIAGLTVAREILESYGCVVRVISPKNIDAAVGAGGTRVELWLPSSSSSAENESSSAHEA